MRILNFAYYYLLIAFVLCCLLFVSCKDKSKTVVTIKKINLKGGDNVGRAVFAGGCFWCMEPPFDNVEGVKATVVGYAGGETDNPNYSKVLKGNTGHMEAIMVEYDPDTVSYDRLLDVFWHNINPIQSNGQFYDIGSQYYTAIFYLTNEQKILADKSLKKLNGNPLMKDKIATRLLPLDTFWQGEQYHQNYYKKNAEHYNTYKKSSGRADFIKRFWGGYDNK